MFHLAKGKDCKYSINNNVKVVLVEPSSFNDAPQICDYIKIGEL